MHKPCSLSLPGKSVLNRITIVLYYFQADSDVNHSAVCQPPPL